MEPAFWAGVATGASGVTTYVCAVRTVKFFRSRPAPYLVEAEAKRKALEDETGWHSNKALLVSIAALEAAEAKAREKEAECRHTFMDGSCFFCGETVREVPEDERPTDMQAAIDAAAGFIYHGKARIVKDILRAMGFSKVSAVPEDRLPEFMLLLKRASTSPTFEIDEDDLAPF